MTSTKELDLDLVLDEIAQLRDEIRRAGRSPWISGTITAANTSTQQASVQVASAGGNVTLPNLAALGTYIPEVGHQVIVLMNGDAPVIIPPAKPITSAAPAQVTGLTVTGAIGGLLISWAALIEADVKWNRGYYQVQVATDVGFTSIVVSQDVAATTTVISGLTTGTTYYVRVRAVDYVGTVGTYSSIVTGVPITIKAPDVSGSLGVPALGVLPTLPNALYPVGSVILLTTDGKLYRNVAGAWSKAVDGGDITALTVTAAQIAANTITAAQIAALTITGAQIAASTITGGKIAANTITAGNIVAATITSTELAANSVTATQLAALNLTVGKFIGSTTFVSGSSGWQINADGSAEFNNVAIRGRADLSVGAEVLSTNAQGLETDTSGWVAQQTAAYYQFDSTTLSFVGSSATLTWESLNYYNPPGGLKAVSTAATYEIRSPAGVSGVATTPGSKHRIVLPVIADLATTGVTMTPCIRWWTSGGVQVGADVTGTAVTVDNGIWRFGTVDAVAPATTAFLSIVYKCTGATGNILYVDEIAITKPANSTIARDTTTFRTGVASLKLTSIAAGLALAGTPDTGDGTGYAVTAGDYYYFRMYYRGSFAPIIVPAWLDNSGVLVATTINQESFALLGDTTYKLYNAVWRVPTGATRLSIAVGFFATGASQVMNFDDFSLTKMSTIQGGVWKSPPEVGSTAQSSTEMSVYLRSSDTGFPYMQANGYVFSRCLHARIRRVSVADATLAQNVATAIAMDLVEENNGMTAVAGGTTTTSYIQVPRTAYYQLTGKLTWKTWLSSGANAAITTEVWAMDSTGATALRLLAVGGEGDTGSAGFGFTQCAADTARLNKGERIVLFGRSGTNTAGHGVTTAQTSLQATYIGDAV